MKWSIFVSLVVCLARFCDGLAIKCLPGATDPSCTEQRKQFNIPEPNQSLSEAVEVQCLASSEWESNCHYCRCSYQGRAECLKQSTDCDKGGVLAEPALCKTNTTFQKDCNTCICLEGGLAFCTMMGCTRSDIPVSASEIRLVSVNANSELDSKDAQKPTKTDVETLNQNHCDIENLLNWDHDVIILKRSTICKPLQEFMRDCNPCKCASDGLSYSCTHNECLETEMNKEVEVFMESEITKSSKNTTKSQVCTANRMFIKDCNTCWCNEDGTSYYCTRRICVPLLPEDQADFGGIPAENLRVVKKHCNPNEVFELDCNMCRCNPDGKSYSCTRRACEEQLEDSKKNVTLSRKVRAFTTESPKTCQPGQEFRMDCNKCLCDSEGQDFSCTRMDCSALNNNHYASAFSGARNKRDTSEQVPMRCVPGSVFNRDCNVCRCTESGEFATCTLKRCTDNKTETEKAPELDQGFRCNPGEQFKRDCNDCTCSADGKSVFCTLRLCDQALTSDI